MRLRLNVRIFSLKTTVSLRSLRAAASAGQPSGVHSDSSGVLGSNCGTPWASVTKSDDATNWPTSIHAPASVGSVRSWYHVSKDSLSTGSPAWRIRSISFSTKGRLLSKLDHQTRYASHGKKMSAATAMRIHVTRVIRLLMTGVVLIARLYGSPTSL